MVENIGKDSAKLRSDPFGNREVLLDAEVHVPEGLAAEVATGAVVTIVDAQNRIAEAVIDRPRIREQVRRRSASKRDRAAGSHKAIVTGSTEAAATDLDGICVGAN